MVITAKRRGKEPLWMGLVRGRDDENLQFQRERPIVAYFCHVYTRDLITVRLCNTTGMPICDCKSAKNGHICEHIRMEDVTAREVS